MYIKDQLWHRALRQPYKLKKIVDVGNSDTIVVLVHGVGAKSQQWAPLVDIINQSKYRVIAYDLLGFGRSPRPEWQSYSTKDHAKSLYASINRDVPRDSRIIIIGHSMGCIISSRLVAEYLSGIKNLILYEPPLLIDADSKQKFYKKLYIYLASRPTWLINTGLKLRRRSDDIYPNKVDDANWLPVERSIKNTILAQETVSDLKLINTPIDVIYGKLDFIVSKINAKKLQEINPRIKAHYLYEAHDITPKSAKYINNLLEEL